MEEMITFRKINWSLVRVCIFWPNYKRYENTKETATAKIMKVNIWLSDKNGNSHMGILTAPLDFTLSDQERSTSTSVRF